jgi:hypothetical protein
VLVDVGVSIRVRVAVVAGSGKIAVSVMFAGPLRSGVVVSVRVLETSIV